MIKVNPYHVLNLSPRGDFPCLSLYAGSENELMTLIDKAEQLSLKRYSPNVLGTLLRPIYGFWHKRREELRGAPLAFFSTKGFYGYSRLPFYVNPLAVVSNSFHVKPLLKWMQREHPFALLRLKRSEAVLYQGSLSHFEEIETLPYRELDAMDGVFNALDRAVYRSIQSAKVPLLLAGEFEQIEAYKSVSGYKSIVEDTILDPSILDEKDRLHLAAIGVLEPYLEQIETALLNSYWTAERTGKTSATLQEIVEFALGGRIKHLFVNERINVWGQINTGNASFTYSPRQVAPEDDVLDDLAEIVLKKNGSVTVLPTSKMPNGKAACAILKRGAGSLSQSLPATSSSERVWQPQAAS